MKNNLTNDNEHEEKLLALAEECFQGQKFDAILKPFESFLLESPKRVRIILKLAEAYFALKSYNESLRLISIAQILDEEKISIYALRIAVSLELNELEKMESEFLHFKTKFSVPNDSHYSILNAYPHSLC